MRLRFVATIDDASEPGDAKYYTNGGGQKVGGLLLVCPGCLKLVVIPFRPVEYPPGWDWDGRMDAPTLTPSIFHQVPGCGWHGYLIAGVLKAV